jgi:co-chaperonin GroES (HSP10)
MTESTEQPKRTETLKKAYKEEAKVKKVLDEKAIDKKLLDRLPTPTGYRMLILPYAGPEKTKGGIFLSENTQETIQLTTVVGFVLKQGNLCYRDKEKFPLGKWCAEKDWVIFGRYAGSRFKITGGEVRILNDDEIIATVSNPADILHHY